MDNNLTAIQFEEVLFEDIYNLFVYFRVPDFFCLKIRYQLEEVEFDDKKFHRPIVEIIPEQKITDQDIIHIIELENGNKIKVVVQYDELMQFVKSRPGGIILRQDIPFLILIKDKIKKAKERGDW